jgi:D-arabinan exo alpha-(1,3)/(1,5)-arabinofuranosidase (non-reducing end)
MKVTPLLFLAAFVVTLAALGWADDSDGCALASLGPLAGLGALPLLTRARTRSVCAENPTGAKGMGGMAVPDPSEVDPPTAARAADDLGLGWKVRPFLRVNAGETATLMDVDGPGIIQHIWIVEGLSRAHVLRFYWDDESTPSVEVPVPDFFAVGHERFAPVNSQVVTANPANALNCYWPMPFRKHARVTLTNEADKDLELVAYQITYAETEVPDEAAYFHAQWRRASTAIENPYVILDGVSGQGRYVGTFLAWTQLRTGWFGEGEIKFFMDGDEEFPTICGTGTEDYFCGSFGFPASYTTAYAGTTLPAKENDPPPQFWSLYRWHIMDPICYDENLRVTIQALGWGKDEKYLCYDDDIASIAYWYQAEPHAAFPALQSVADRRRIAAPPDMG